MARIKGGYRKIDHSIIIKNAIFEKDIKKLELFDLCILNELSVIMYAISYYSVEMVMYLIDRGVCIESPIGYQDVTPLMYAIKINFHHIYRLLINNGSNINRVFDKSPIKYAVIYDRFDIFKYLFTQVDNIYDVDNNAYNLSHLACLHNSIKIFKYLYANNYDMKRIDNCGNGCLHLAAQSNCLDLLIYIIDKKIYDNDIYEVNYNGENIFHIACMRNSIKVINYLLSIDYDVNIVTYNGQTALHLTESVDVIEILIKQTNIDVNIVDTTGCKALHFAIDAEKCKYFVDNNVYDICDQTLDGKDIFQIAYNNRIEDLLRYLIVDKNFDISLYIVSLNSDIDNGIANLLLLKDIPRFDSSANVSRKRALANI